MKRLIATTCFCESRDDMSSILIVILTNWLGRAAVYTRCAFLRKNLQYLRFMTCYVFMLRALQIEYNCFHFSFIHQISL